MMSDKATISNIAFLITEQMFEFSQQSTKTILERRDSRIKKLITRFSKNPETQPQRLKLQFHLFIAYLAVVVVNLQLSDHFRLYAQQIVDEIVKLFHSAFNDSGKPIDDGLVVGEEFIMDLDERNVVLAELKRVNPSLGVGLPRMGLTAIADMLLERRLNQYLVMWIDDMQRMEQDGFVALMPTKVYQHWSGDSSRSFESISFGLLLSAGLIPFSTTLSKALETIRVQL